MDPLRTLIHLGLKTTEATLDRAVDVVRLVDTLLVASAVPREQDARPDEPVWPEEEQADLDALSATLRAREEPAPATASTGSARPARKKAPAAKKASSAAKKAATKKAATKKAPATKKASSAAKKTSAKKTSAKKAATKKAPAAKKASSAAKKTSAKKAATKKASSETPSLVVLPDA